jgi:hypothetical protein
MFMPFPPATALAPRSFDVLGASEMQIDDKVNDHDIASVECFVRLPSPLTLASARFVGRGLG